MTLFNEFALILTPDVLSRIAAYIDEPTEKTSRATDALIYTIVGGLMKRTTTEIGVNQLYKYLQKGNYTGSVTDNLEEVLRDPAHTNTLITQGNDVISHLLPAMKSSIASMVSGYAGVRNSSAISLLGLTTTIVLHVLGKHTRERKLDANGVASLLFAERDALVTAVPDELMPTLIEKIGLQQVVAGVAGPARRPDGESARTTDAVMRPPVTYELTDAEQDDNGSLAKWGIGALIALLIGIGGYYVYQNTQEHAGEEPAATEISTLGDSIQTADTVARSLAVPVDTSKQMRATPATAATTATGMAVGAPPTPVPNGLSLQLTPYLANPTLPKGRVFPLSGVAFLPGSLSMTAGSQAAINELVTVLKTNPALQIQLIGFATDGSAGLPNKTLSFKRVNVVKQQIVSAGIDYLRVDAIGRGTGISPRAIPGTVTPVPTKIEFKVVVK